MLPEGFTARPITLTLVHGLFDGPDVDDVFQIKRAAEVDLMAEYDVNREAVRAELAAPETVLSESKIVVGPDGRDAGALIVECEADLRRVYLDTYVVPRHRVNLLPSIVKRGITTAEHLSAGAPDWDIHTAVHATDELAAEILTAAGFRPVRRYWRLAIDLSDYPHADPIAPASVTMSIAYSESDRRILHRIHTEAFAGEFGFVAEPFEDWVRWHDERKDHRPDLWWLAWLDGQPVAHITQDDSRADIGKTYIRSLAVAAPARGRGIATWLLQTAFAHSAREGRVGAMLTVDSENPTGATALYEGVGMKPVQVIDVYARPI